MTEAIHIKRRAEVAAQLLTGKHLGFKFEMSTYLVGKTEGKKICNSAGCIAGLTVLLFSEDPIPFMYEGEIEDEIDEEARKLLGLTLGEASVLFIPNYWNGADIYDVTEIQAGRTMARFFLTDKIDWFQKDEPIKVGDRTF